MALGGISLLTSEPTSRPYVEPPPPVTVAQAESTTTASPRDLLARRARTGPSGSLARSLLALARGYSRSVTHNMPHSGAGTEKAGSTLSPRQESALILAAQGRSNPEIAGILGISPVAVGKLLSRAYAALGAANRAEAVARWRKA